MAAKLPERSADYAYLLKEKPNAKVAILYQNDDFGKDYLKGVQDGLGDKKSMIIAEESYELSEPTIDSHIVKLKALNPDVLLIFTTPKFGAQTIKRSVSLPGSRFDHFERQRIHRNGDEAAGFENAQGIISAAYAKDTSDPQWDNDPGMKEYKAFSPSMFLKPTSPTVPPSPVTTWRRPWPLC